MLKEKQKSSFGKAFLSKKRFLHRFPREFIRGQGNKRAIIIAKGEVQKVGYRDFVQDSARELGIAGFVENLEDGNVKIICEGEEH